MCMLPSPARSNEAYFTKIEKAEKSFEKQGGQNPIFEGISEGVFISSEYFWNTFKKGRLLSLYSEEQNIFMIFPVLPQNWVSISYPFVQMSERINLFSQLGCPFGLSQWEQVKGLLIFSKYFGSKHPPKWHPKFRVGEGINIFSLQGVQKPSPSGN